VQERAEADHGNIRRGLIAPEILEPICRQFGVAGGMLNVAVPQIMLDRPRVLPVVGQLVAGGVAQHVGWTGNSMPASRPARATILRTASAQSGALRSLTNT
jgi:hypothetical protein